MLIKSSVNSHLELVCLAIFSTFVVLSVPASGWWLFGHSKIDQLKSSLSSSSSAAARSPIGDEIYVQTPDSEPHERLQVFTGLLDPLLRETATEARQLARQQVDGVARAYSYDGSQSDDDTYDEEDSLHMDRNKLVFELYSDRGQYRCLIYGIPDERKLAKFCPEFDCDNKDIGIITHGMTSHNFTRGHVMAEEDRLESGFDSAIFFDWTVHSDIRLYLSALHRRKYLGDILGDFVLLLRKTKQLMINRVHLMGYSMGAHVMAFAARRIKNKLDKQLPIENHRLHKVRALTAFDAASPLISYKMFLHREDALVVQGIHTSYHFGVTRAFGHLDFFPNGGNHQTGCYTNELFKSRTMADSEVCDHNYSIPLFVESFKHRDNSPCHFVGYPCEDYDSFLEGKCNKCATVGHSTNCHRLSRNPIISEGVSRETTVNRKMFFLTGKAPQLCVPNYHLRMSMDRKEHRSTFQRLRSWLGDWFERSFKLKVELVHHSKLFAVHIEAFESDKILQKVITHRFSIGNNGVNHAGAAKPVKFDKIYVTSEEKPEYYMDTIEITYMSHSKKEIRDKYSAAFRLSRRYKFKSSQSMRKVYLLEKGYPP